MFHPTQSSRVLSGLIALSIMLSVVSAPTLATDVLLSAAVAQAAVGSGSWSETISFRVYLPLIRRSGDQRWPQRAKIRWDYTNPIGWRQPPRSIRKRRRCCAARCVIRTAQASSGVTISIQQHPEYGTVLTDADGIFELMVNGGVLLTVNYDKAGYLPAQRQITPAHARLCALVRSGLATA